MSPSLRAIHTSAAVGWPRWTDRLVAPLSEGGRRVGVPRELESVPRPLVSYVTIVRNNRATLHRAIESVRGQTYPSVEHIVLDGASTDGTLDVIRGYADRLDYFASEPDEGIYDALNKAIPLARGDLICVLNSDDWLETGAAQTAVGLLTDVGAPTILLTGAHVRQGPATDHEPPILLEWYPAQVHAGTYFTCANDCHNGIYSTRSAYERSGPYDTSYGIAGDFKWLMSCFESGVDFVYTKDITVNYLMGGASSDAEGHGIECVRAIRDRFPFLTPEEAGGLYHSFFAFPTFASIPGRPGDRSAFLRELMSHHPDVATAVAWALLAEADRQADDDGDEIVGHEPVPSFSIRELVKRALHGHPRAYGLAKQLHGRVRRT